MEHEPKEVQEQLRRQNRRAAGRVVVRSDLNKVNAHNFVPPRNLLQKLKNLVVEKAAMAGRSGARSDGRTEGIYVDCYVHS